ncbi:MAG: protein kinase domain-containing protein, partial [Bacillota bacterium]
MLGKVLNDRYKILKKLGKGGMARVFEAQDLLLDRKVAIKMLRGEFVSDKEFIEKFRHEAKAVARIAHPNVVSIFDIGQDDDYHYLVMEDIEGRNLKDIIQDRGSLSVIEALDIANQIVAALVVAHNNNIIHCDIKPHNILINRNKQVKVTDFGIARAVTSSTTHVTDTIMGSAHYFSPEQARGGEIKTHSDLYSVGIVLYEMLTGEVPFTGDSPISVALKHIQN